MLLSLNQFLFTVIMLTALFSITAGLAFIFRKSALKGKESGMYFVWLAILIFALLPIRIGEPTIILFPQETIFSNENAQINNMDNTGKQNNTVKLSDLLKFASRQNITDDDIPEFNANKNTADREPQISTSNNKLKINLNIIKWIGDHKIIIISGLLMIWLAGFMFVLGKTIYNYFKMKKLFYKESDRCADERIKNIFNECLEIVGIKRRVNLRILNWDLTSPCVCGLFEPTVFIDESCIDLSDKKIKYIFIHELYHIKRYDMLYKMLAVIVAGAHWFNPLTYKVIKTAAEDCEFSVDRHVMDIIGNEQSDYYMNIILDIAERGLCGGSKCVANNKPLVNIPSTGLFFGEKRNVKFLKRRYHNMKNIINKKHLIIALSVFLTAIMAINIIIMSACSIGGTVEAAGSAAQRAYDNIGVDCADKNVYETALRFYFGLLPGEEITEEQLAEITDIKIIRGIRTDGFDGYDREQINYGNLTPVSFVINDREFNHVPSIVHRRVFENILKTVWDTSENNQRTIDKLNAYYTIKDPNNFLLEPEDIEEMYLEYPMTKEYPIAVLDPNASDREYLQIYGYFAAAGLLDDGFVQNGTIDASYLLKLPNLKTATFVNLTAENLHLPGVTTIMQESPYVYVDGDGYVNVGGDGPAQNPAGQISGPSGVFEAPNYGINTADDGTEYLEFKNQSLYAALMEYFGLDRWYGSYITPDMLNQINSIEVKVKPEYNYLYDNIGLREEFNLDCKYIEYTINGKTLDILPEKFIEGGIIEGIFGDNISEYFDYEPGYYITKTDLSIENKLAVYYELAKNAAYRVAVYQDDNGKYFTYFMSWSIYALCFPERYYDKNEYDASDIAYMPNLVSFNVDGLTLK